MCSLFCSVLLAVFSFWFLVVSVFQKYFFILGFSSDIFVFHLVSIKLESGFQKNKLSSFNLI